MPTNSLLLFITRFFSRGDERTVKAKRSILGLVLSKGCSLAISLLFVPVVINYISPVRYGMWLTLSSMVAWMSFFDIGINNGLRNKLAGALAINDFEQSRRLISTTYAILCIIFIPLLLILTVVNSFVNWSSVLNTSEGMLSELHIVAMILFGFFCINFILSTINIVLLADQRPAEAAYRSLIEQGFSLLIIFLLSKFTNGSLVKLAVGLCIVPLVVLLYFNIALFKSRYKHISPSFSKIDFSLAKDLLSVGLQFFVIQIAGVVQFQTANIILIRSFGPLEVTNYNICFKYFSMLNMGMSILITPLWSSVTNAYAKHDYEWIKNAVKKYTKISLAFLVLGVLMFCFSSYFYSFWIRNSMVNISTKLSFWMLIFSLCSVFGGVYSGVLNGIGALKIQFRASLISPLLFIGLSYFFINLLHWGVYSIVVAIIIANFNGYLLAPWQYYAIFSDKSISNKLKHE